jgi:hypothetical protein
MIQYRGLPAGVYIQGDTCSRVLFVSLFVRFFVCRKTADVATSLSHWHQRHLHAAELRLIARDRIYRSVLFFWFDPF